MIKFYSKKGCVQCKVLKGVLDNNGIQYEYIEDENIYMPIAKEHKIMGMPFGEIDGVVYNPIEFKKFVTTGDKKGEDS